jgi:hypothetical protein
MTDPFTTAELVAASTGREGTILVILRDAIAQIEDSIRQRVLRDAAALGLDVDALARTLDGTDRGAPVEKLAAKPRPEAPADDGALLKLLFAELDKGEALSAKALARRTGAAKDRVGALLLNNVGDRLALYGVKWSRKAAP